MTLTGITEKIVTLFLFKNPSINILLLVCLTYFVSGYVFVRLIQSKSKEFNQFKLLLSPLFGFSFLGIFLNTAIIFGIQMKFLVFPVLLELLISSTLIVYDQLKLINLRVFVVIITSLIVLLFSSIGLFNLGKNYLGYGWVDSLNYISSSEILKDYQLKVPKIDLINKAYLLPGLDVKDDRIAQSLVIVFFSLLTGENTKTIFGPVLLSSVFLFFISMFLLIKLFFKSFFKSILIAVNIGISSSFAMIHIETFLSHALALPYVITYIYLIETFKKNISKYNLFCVGIIFSTLFFLYPELIPILLLISVPYLFMYFKKQNFTSIIVLIFTVLFFFIINKSVVLNIILNRVGTKLSVLDPIYGFSGTIFMLNRILFGHIDIWNLLTVFSIFFVFFSIINIFYIIKNKESDKYGVLATLIFLVLLFPLSFSYKYHYFKLFLTISPIIILSFYIFLDRLAKKNIFFNILFFFILLFCLFYTAKGTRNIIRFTYLPGQRSQIGGLYIYEDSQLFNYLEKTSGKTFLINGRNSMETAWLSYHARNNKIKVISPDFAMRDISAISPKIIFEKAEDLNKYEIISTQKYPTIINSSKELYPYFNNVQGLEGDYPNQFTWIGKKAEFGFISKKTELSGHLFLDLQKGPFSDSLIRKFNIDYGGNLLAEESFNEQRKLFEYPVDLSIGKNTFYINTIMSNPIKSNSNDIREFNILVSDLKLFICDGSFKKIFFILPETDGWVTNSGFRVIGCVTNDSDNLRIDFSQIVELRESYNFLINNLPTVTIRNDNSIIITEMKRFINKNFLSIEIKPEFSKNIGKDLRQLSFFPINYEKK